MAVDKRRAKRELEELLTTLSWHLIDLEAYRENGDAAGAARCEPLVKAQEGRIREHCAEHGLELPHDVPPEDAA